MAIFVYLATIVVTIAFRALNQRHLKTKCISKREKGGLQCLLWLYRSTVFLCHQELLLTVWVQFLVPSTNICLHVPQITDCLII